MFWKIVSTNCNTWSNYWYFSPKFSWYVTNNWYTTCQCFHKVPMPQIINWFHIHVSKFVLMQTNQRCMNHFLCLSFQTSRNQSIQSLLQHIDMLIFITLISIEIVEFQCIRKLKCYYFFIQTIHNYLHILGFHHHAFFQCVLLIKKIHPWCIRWYLLTMSLFAIHHYYNSWFFKLFKLITLSTLTNEHIHFD